jgi:hypothetical protein
MKASALSLASSTNELLIACGRPIGETKDLQQLTTLDLAGTKVTDMGLKELNLSAIRR